MSAAPCPKCCGGIVDILPTEGGRGTGQPTIYVAECVSCGRILDCLPSSCNGKKSSAEAEYNRWAKAEIAKRDQLGGRTDD